MHDLTHLDLFSGIGGFSLGFESVGFQTIAFAETDAQASLILQAHWPTVPNLGDVRGISRNMVDSLVSQRDIPHMLDDKYHDAPAMYQRGLSSQEIADYFNVSRQSMWKILQRRGVEFRSQARSGEENHFYRGGRTYEKRAHRLVETAIRRGILVPASCEQCGLHNSIAHHDDYSKPLEVRWLCKTHHHEWHKHNRAKHGKEALRNAASARPTVITGGVP